MGELCEAELSSFMSTLLSPPLTELEFDWFVEMEAVKKLSLYDCLHQVLTQRLMSKSCLKTNNNCKRCEFFLKTCTKRGPF